MSRVSLFVESYLKKTIIEREFEFLELDDDFNLVPLKQSSSYDGMTTIILFDREMKLAFKVMTSTY